MQLTNVYGRDSPRVLLADAAEEITHGYEQVYGEPVYRIYCWIHMERNFKKHLASKGIGTSQKIIGPIIADLQNIQIQMSETKFKKSASLFATKWQNHYDNEIQAKSSQMRDFLKYFEDNWIKKRTGWYEGYAQGYPSESNAIESNNRVLKNEQTMRVRMPVSQFINLIDQFALYYVNLLPTFSHNF